MGCVLVQVAAQVGRPPRVAWPSAAPRTSDPRTASVSNESTRSASGFSLVFVLIGSPPVKVDCSTAAGTRIGRSIIRRGTIQLVREIAI
jgi:hypothetical protein